MENSNTVFTPSEKSRITRETEIVEKFKIMDGKVTAKVVELANQFGISISSIYSIIRKAGLTNHNNVKAA